MRRLSCFAVLALFTFACAKTSDSTATASVPAEVTTAAESITASGLLQHIKDLSDDSLEGRGPGTPGEDKAVAYMEGQFKALGLKPGNPDGTFIQKVQLIGYKSHPTASFSAGGKTVALKYPDDYVANSRHNRKETKVANSDVVFVGYGVVAPEYGWDDYKGVDVKGKTVLMLINDPAVPAAGQSASKTGETAAADLEHLDSTMFKGKAMTYYGRWTYKYEIATQKGAAAVLIVHETAPAAYGYNVVRSSNSIEAFDVVDPAAESRVPIEGWITLPKARELFAAAGADWNAAHALATTKDFKPIALNAKANIDVKIDARTVQSRNIVAKLEGTDKKDEYVVYTAHWDHLGRNASVKGDQIYNGALDNASGSAMLLEIAKAYTKLATPPRRSILFLSVTAEEKGLLGAKYYASNPLYPLTQTVANINMDGVNQWGKTKDFTVIGLGNSSLDDVLTSVLTSDGRVVRPDQEPEKGFYYRSDHFEFAKKGVPALDPDAGVDFIGKDSTYGMKKRDDYTTRDYHQPSDEVKPDWDLSGGVDDGRVLFRVGYLVAQADAIPAWKAGNEFKAKRDSMMTRK